MTLQECEIGTYIYEHKHNNKTWMLEDLNQYTKRQFEILMCWIIFKNKVTKTNTENFPNYLD